jgi:ubiquinone/menaquinone biosynthesis C-methylase UbiE
MTGLTTGAETIIQILRAPYPYFVMFAGMQLDLFNTLKGVCKNAEEIADTIGANPGKLRPLLYALVAAGLLTLEGDCFANTAEADRFLVSSSPSYLGDHAKYNVNPTVMSWMLNGALKTAESIRTGIPQLGYDFSSLSEAELEKGFRATQPIAVRAGRELAARYDFKDCRTLVDVGGGVGGLALAVTEAYPDLKATVLDLPLVAPITRRFLEETSATERIRVITADLVRETLNGSFDVAVMRALIQVLLPEEASRALGNAYKLLNPGGVIYVLGHILADSRTSPPEEVWYSTLNINFYPVPGTYTEQEYTDWLRQAGFEQVKADRLPNGDGVMAARKPA